MGVGFGVPFFVSGLYKFMGKLADRIFFGVQGPRRLEYFSVSRAHGAWVWGAVLCMWPF